MSIKQQKDETLRAYISRFNKEALSIDKADNKILVAAFTNGLKKGKFLISLYKNDPKTMSEVLYRATKYMNAEDAMLARDERPKKRERQEDTRQDQGRKKARTGDQRDERRPKPLGGRFTNFTPLTAPIDQVLMQIKDEEALTFPGKLKSDPNKRSRDKQEKLQKFVSNKKTDPPPQDQHPRQDNEQPRPPIGDIRMIVGGTAVAGSSKKTRKTYLRMVQNVQLTGVMPKIARREGPIIGFSEKDARRLHHPHDDALVVSLRVEDYNMHRVLVDNGSSADILYYSAFQQMRIDRERLILTNAPLVGFRGSRVFPLGAVTLSEMVGDYPQQITKNITFLVVDYSSAYNAILGRPTLNSWKAVTSTYHLMIKFPTDYGVRELRRSQMAARECYVAMMEMEDQVQALSIEEHRTVMEPVEKLEEIPLGSSNPGRTTKIGTLANPAIRQELITFLRGNRDVFA
ncbi:uncharacterized protein LOC115966935 [Quercus lobata]|uniref:uncharacterized protein LOC115966935 n=1 Tax=Quercus lobata TaxID=97700 RepID=UPI0012492F45|nr:uncharacterized protein LOC115966935 [Quercus lobata]